ncbi:MAG: cob(I)yrinic acid a,c-diamide adenosyltransferase [Roseibium album]|uniref:Corrinoid adenosyltransferase n=1 Tax=Roseibium album TaxID=311410 RepID=A0A0M6ZVK7_9HYPH|nr:cob(I)yrinic acid a,c-diamide adenosyltransferase [Roseibium album]MBG6145676.1 cob(I)alamin adenosyltransferase [Labrenzia sp. EL_142]MBG6163059.1 cob(I)alamin adenosyltransferase [Labrenzia sp. EL_195]MBG6174482.1 cob(I)alamin adenosyltransferase [Labrenzia sp. EL_132]MBG6201403.1 cob(I)alamin adenosyltransferase [Labrenzia sp. EL_13]MBG6229236.1 cob(I)alamin adenosyltransferase [Labrenzia sp. EL_208]MCR9058999.1 cob(I)yrinic acid a,c-diamide adenosyltransferase [Paracoccaceae bacterium]
MVVLNKIYTKTGDDGTTALGTGERRPKNDLRIDAYGTVDETNAVVGLVRLHTSGSAPEVDLVLGRIQNDLFDLGADLATPETDQDLGYEPLRITDSQVTALETAIDDLNSELTPLRSFVLPGGSGASAHLHLARTVSRRAERLMVELAPNEKINPAAIRYMNRLSDYFFVASRFLNEKGEQDVLWVPGQNR